MRMDYDVRKHYIMLFRVSLKRMTYFCVYVGVAVIIACTRAATRSSVSPNPVDIAKAKR